jgi:hypothetical protein
MKKTLVLMVFIVSLSVFVAGCSKGGTQTTDSGSQTDSGSASGMYPAGSEDSGKSDTPQEIPDSTITSGEIVVTESKTQVEKNDATLEALIIADGTYVDNEDYMSPGGLDTIEVTLSVDNDIVTAVDIKAIVADKTSQNYINKVDAALPDLVIGKSISEIQNLPKQISGSSLTTAAFKKQVQQFIAENPA